MTSVHFVWDPVEDNVVRELDTVGAAVADYTTEPDFFGGVISQRRSGQSRFFHFDGVGSTLAVTDAAANVTDTREYSAFGETTATSGSTVFPFQYVGQRGYHTDSATGEVNVRRRVYRPQLGRWLSRDPLVVVFLSLAKDAYAYSNQCPTSHHDPSGLFAEQCTSGIFNMCCNALAIQSTKPKCVVDKANAFVLKQKCGFIVGLKTQSFGFEIASDFEFSKTDDPSCKCCVFEQWVLEAVNEIWITWSGKRNPLGNTYFNSEINAFDDGYGDRKKQEKGDEYGDCTYSMFDRPGIDVMDELIKVDKANPGVGLLKKITLVEVVMIRSFFQRITDSCNSKKQVWGEIFRKRCAARFVLSGGKLAPPPIGPMVK